ncbi:MAG: DUF2934 domain-containing protein [Victivallales bacterium]
MNEKVGMWIDHRKAVIAVVSGGKEKVNVIESKVDKQLGRYDGVRSTSRFDRVQVQSDDSQDRLFINQINKFYDKVIASIRDAESILIFGPGEAKVELKKRLEKNRLGGRIEAVEAADKMTDPQIEERVRKFYQAKVSPSRKGVAASAPMAGKVRKSTGRPAAKGSKGGGGKSAISEPEVFAEVPVQEEKAEISQDDVASLAYQIYLKEGCPQGRSMEHWLRAEAQLRSGE